MIERMWSRVAASTDFRALDAPCSAAGSGHPRIGGMIHARSPDPWFGEDKLRHFFLAFAATSFVYAAASTAGVDRRPGLVAAGAAGLASGVGKEAVDRARGGEFSLKDLVWDAAGVAAAVLLLSGTR